MLIWKAIGTAVETAVFAYDTYEQLLDLLIVYIIIAAEII